MSRRGFTLVETILVLTIIGIGLFGLMYLYGNMTYRMYHADLQVMAADYAQQKVEQVIAKKAFSGYGAIVTEAAETLTTGIYTFTRTMTVDFIDPATMAVSGSNTGYKRIMVSVASTGGPTITVYTLVTNQVPLL